MRNTNRANYVLHWRTNHDPKNEICGYVMPLYQCSFGTKLFKAPKSHHLL